jgi:hypothetical protein
MEGDEENMPNEDEIVALVSALFLVTRGNASKHDTTSHDLCLTTIIGGDAGFRWVDNSLSRCACGGALTTMLAASTGSRGERSKRSDAG